MRPRATGVTLSDCITSPLLLSIHHKLNSSGILRTTEYAIWPPCVAYSPLRQKQLLWLLYMGIKLKVHTLAFRLFFDTRIDTFPQMHLDWPLHMLAISPSRMGRLRQYWFA